MYHLSTQYKKWLFTVEELKELRTKVNNDYVQRSVRIEKEIKFMFLKIIFLNRIRPMV